MFYGDIGRAALGEPRVIAGTRALTAHSPPAVR
jgi:hypothetical protein